MAFAFRGVHTSIVLRIALLLSLLWITGLAQTRNSAPQYAPANPELQASSGQALAASPYPLIDKDSRIAAPAPPPSFSSRPGALSMAPFFAVLASLASVLAFYRLLR